MRTLPGRIRAGTGGGHEICCESILDHPGGEFDVVFALYIFHHLVKTKERHDALIALLRRLEIGSMVFGSHQHDQSAMQTAYRNFTPGEWIEFLLEYTPLVRARRIGVEAGRREIHLLES